jgi:RimJ/RimL family protein N-acetyltransferase
MVSSIRTPRLLLRCWEPGDAIALKTAIDSSLPELQTWVERTLEHPMSVSAVEKRLAEMRDQFSAGSDWTFGIFGRAHGRLIGGAGLHPRGTKDRVELGYWLRTDCTGKGLASEAAAALCTIAFRHTQVDRVDVLCDARNRRSGAVARRLGFSVEETFPQRVATKSGRERDTERWSLSRAVWLRRS